jgi:hypothetical protein
VVGGREGIDMSGPAKCPTCGGRLEGVEPQRLRTRGAAPTGVQLYVAPCPHCGAAAPLAAVTATAMARHRAPTVHQKVRGMLAAPTERC